MGPWASGYFNTIVNSGQKGFTTYVWENNRQVPGLGVEMSDIVNGLWSPDQVWTFANKSFASLNMFRGTYTVSDAVTGESITFQIGESRNEVPVSSTLLLAAFGLAGLGLTRRKKLKV